MDSKLVTALQQRNKYGFVAVLSLYVLIHTAARLFNWEREDVILRVMDPIGVLAGLFLVTISCRRASVADTTLLSGLERPYLKTEDRLDELERLKRRDMVTPEEYATKRQEILKDL